ncbi:hypothetical protein D1872_243120 [compost metagenome]
MQSWMEMLGVMNTAFPIFFIIILGIIIASVGGSIRRYYVNSKQPILFVHTTIVSKRTDVSHRHDAEHSRSDTRYYVTFEVESGDRLEFMLTGSEYGQCSEGDEGNLKFQGSRYFGFERLSKTYRTGLQQQRHY